MYLIFFYMFSRGRIQGRATGMESERCVGFTNTTVHSQFTQNSPPNDNVISNIALPPKRLQILLCL